MIRIACVSAMALLAQGAEIDNKLKKLEDKVKALTFDHGGPEFENGCRDYSCTLMGGAIGASICPLKGDCECVGGAGEGNTCTDQGHIKPWCFIAPSHYQSCATWSGIDANGKVWSEVRRHSQSNGTSMQLQRPPLRWISCFSLSS